MDPGELFTDLPELVGDVAELAPAEVLPAELAPVFAAGWIVRLLLVFGRHAYLLAFAGALVENTVFLGFLLPGGTVVALASAGGHAAGLSLPALALLAAAGMTSGAIVDYMLGRTGAARLLEHRRAGRLGRALAAQLAQAGPLLRRHGWWIMLVAHAFGHGRSTLAVAAGAARLPLARFLAIELPAALLWGSLYAGGGYLLADQWHHVDLALRTAGWLGAGALLVGVLLWWFWRWSLRRRPQAGAGGADPA